MSFFLRVDPRRARHPKWSVLSDAAYRFADEILCWGAENETSFIPKATLVRMAGTPRRAKRLAHELVVGCAQKSRRNVGILELADDGYVIHDAEQYWPENKKPPQTGQTAEVHQLRSVREPNVADLSAKRAAAGRAGGLTSAARRQLTTGTAQPKQTPKQTKQTVEANPKQTVEANPEANQANLDLSSSILNSNVSTEVLEPKDLSADTRAQRDEGRQQKRHESEAKPESESEQYLLLSVHTRALEVCTDGVHTAVVPPEGWPETKEIAQAFGEALGQPVTIGAYERDPGVKAIVEVLAAGFTMGQLRRVALYAARDPWWRERRRGISSLSSEVIRRSLGFGDEQDRAQRARTIKDAEQGVYGPTTQRLARDGKIDEALDRVARQTQRRAERVQ